VEPGGQLFSSEDEARVTVLHIIPEHHHSTSNKKQQQESSVANPDPGSIAFLTPGSGIRDW
jgi:hypothetical protein